MTVRSSPPFSCPAGLIAAGLLGRELAASIDARHCANEVPQRQAAKTQTICTFWTHPIGNRRLHNHMVLRLSDQLTLVLYALTRDYTQDAAFRRPKAPLRSLRSECSRSRRTPTSPRNFQHSSLSAYLSKQVDRAGYRRRHADNETGQNRSQWRLRLPGVIVIRPCARYREREEESWNKESDSDDYGLQPPEA